MELIHIIQEIVQYIPQEYTAVIAIMNHVVPMILIGISLLVCFLGYRLVKIWSAVYFFFLGFLLGSFSGVFFMQYAIDIWVFIGIGLILGILGAYFSRKLHKIQLFLVNFMTVYVLLPNILGKFMSSEISIVIGLLVSILVAILSIKYRYPITITTTSIQGAFFAVGQTMQVLGYDNVIILYVWGAVVTLMGILVQVKVGKDPEKKKENENAEKTI